MHVQYSSNERRFVYKGLHYRMMERHDRCACECLVKATDCRPEQIYLEDECRCVCSPDNRLQCLNQQQQQMQLDNVDNEVKPVQYSMLTKYKQKRFNVGSIIGSRLFVWNETECKCNCKYMPFGVASDQCFISNEKSLTSHSYHRSTDVAAAAASLLMPGNSIVSKQLLMNTKVVTLEHWNENETMNQMAGKIKNFQTPMPLMPLGNCCQQSNGQMLMPDGGVFNFNFSKNYCR